MGAIGVSKFSLKYSCHVDGTLDDLGTYLPMLPSIQWHGKIVFDASKLLGILCFGWFNFCATTYFVWTNCGLVGYKCIVAHGKYMNEMFCIMKSDLLIQSVAL
jgi:hypothetical protein